MTAGEYLFKKREIVDLWNQGMISTGVRNSLLNDLDTQYFRSNNPPAPTKDAVADEEDSGDPVTYRLMKDALKTHGYSSCPKCGDPGRFIRMALVCPAHGVFGGA